MCAQVCLPRTFWPFMNLWLCLSHDNREPTCHMPLTTSHKSIRPFCDEITQQQAHSTSIRWAVVQLSFVTAVTRQKDTHKTVSNKREVGKRLPSFTDKSSFGCSRSDVDLLRVLGGSKSNKVSNSRFFLCHAEKKVNVLFWFCQPVFELEVLKRED